MDAQARRRVLVRTFISISSSLAACLAADVDTFRGTAEEPLRSAVPLSVALLGPVHLEVDGSPATPSGVRERSLLAALLPVPRHEIAHQPEPEALPGGAGKHRFALLA